MARLCAGTAEHGGEMVKAAIASGICAGD